MKNTYHIFPASNLIDKNTMNFAHTTAVWDGIWIRVYLTEPSWITKIVVYNRQDCCKDRIEGLTLFIKSGEVIATDCGTIAVIKDVYKFDCAGWGNVVELSKEGRVTSQNIAEIMVYQRNTSNGEYSMEYRVRCHF